MQEELSSGCKLPAELIFALLQSNEHPCDTCNHDRKECRGYPRLDETNKNSKILGTA